MKQQEFSSQFAPGRKANRRAIKLFDNNWKAAGLEKLHIRCLGDGRLSASWGPIRGPSQTHSTIVLWWFEGSLQLGPHDAERRKSLGQLYAWSVKFFQSGQLWSWFVVCFFFFFFAFKLRPHFFQTKYRQFKIFTVKNHHGKIS